jgi:hypothetical protein
MLQDFKSSGGADLVGKGSEMLSGDLGLEAKTASGELLIYIYSSSLKRIRTIGFHCAVLSATTQQRHD